MFVVHFITLQNDFLHQKTIQRQNILLKYFMFTYLKVIVRLEYFVTDLLEYINFHNSQLFQVHFTNS